jgi:hypothetical protein
MTGEQDAINEIEEMLQKTPPRCVAMNTMTGIPMTLSDVCDLFRDERFLPREKCDPRVLHDHTIGFINGDRIVRLVDDDEWESILETIRREMYRRTLDTIRRENRRRRFRVWIEERMIRIGDWIRRGRR